MLSWIKIKKFVGCIVSNIGFSFAGEVDAVVIVYDLTSFASFHSATLWIDSNHHNMHIYIK